MEETNRLWPGTRVLWRPYGQPEAKPQTATVANGYWDDSNCYYITIERVTYASAHRSQLTALPPFANI